MIVICNIALVVTLVLVSGCSTQTVWTWKFNTNFNNTDNWDRHEIPCKTNVVIFPKDMQVPVILPTSKMGKSIVEIRRIVLSRQGWLIFPRMGGGISLSNEEIYASCSGGDSKFKRTGRKKWADAESWLSSSEFSSKATPHLERIPCQFDVVSFPDESTFSIALPSRPLSVSSVKIQGQEIKRQSEWSKFLDSYGYEFFPGLLERGLESIKVSGETCGDVSGCECGNARLSDDICSDQSKWVDPPCADPVKPIGFCHRVCGAYLLFKEGSIREIRSETKAFLKSEDIISHTSKANGFVQVVLMDKNDYTGDIKDFAKQLYQHLVNRGLVKHTASTTVNFSGLKTNRIESRIILKRFLIGLLCSLLVFGVIFCLYEKNGIARSLDWERWSSIWGGNPSETWGFARFENTSGTVEISEEVVAVIPMTTQTSNDCKFEFDNPMFSGNLQSSDGVVLSEFERRRGSIDSESQRSSLTGSFTASESTSHDQLSMKEVNLGPLHH